MSSPNSLAHQTILVTRSTGQSRQFVQQLQQAGATVLELPAIQILPPSSWQALDQAIAQLDQFDWLILTSTNGVDAFFARLAAQDLSLAQLAHLKIAVVGQKTAAQLQANGRQPDFIPPDFVADALAEHFPGAATGLRLLFPRVETGGRELLVKALSAQGAIVTEVPAYQSGCTTVLPPEIATALQQQQITIVTFASSKTVACFHQLLQSAGISLDPNCCIASIGPQTSLTCRDCLGRVDLEAAEYTLEGLTQAMIDWATQNRQREH
ncbi:MAG: uroporphyrinogen-III synthase [Pegethrix bostrychoides GSE-TBD4-15B]|uniref:Uroporphyrinogen-III synthase n=1 Tax=Pegethrix bostrychoides GSE-TBD4-15B TaxID=2839662 RepID=A0A951P9L5_9CYAN|nr:uroporphyrinogen-III synthase [Pegethrix bostrychoides GSE-TBD4-15B]